MKITLDRVRSKAVYYVYRHNEVACYKGFTKMELFNEPDVDAVAKKVNLQGANLRGADLQGEKLKITPIQLYGLRWETLITAEYLKIGCERHKHAEWEGFDRLKITEMDKGAWDWWKEHKDALLGLCKIHKAEANKGY